MKVILNDRSILFPMEIHRVDEQDANGKEISKNIKMVFPNDVKMTFVCEDVITKDMVWREIMKNETTIDLRLFSPLIKLQLQ